MLDTSCGHHCLVVPGKPALSHISVGMDNGHGHQHYGHGHQHGHQHHHLLFLIFTFPWWNSTRSANLRLLSNLKSAPMSIYHHLHLFYRTQARRRYGPPLFGLHSNGLLRFGLFMIGLSPFGLPMMFGLSPFGLF